jgi:hypothetical protein
MAEAIVAAKDGETCEKVLDVLGIDINFLGAAFYAAATGHAYKAAMNCLQSRWTPQLSAELLLALPGCYRDHMCHMHGLSMVAFNLLVHLFGCDWSAITDESDVASVVNMFGGSSQIWPEDHATLGPFMVTRDENGYTSYPALRRLTDRNLRRRVDTILQQGIDIWKHHVTMQTLGWGLLLELGATLVSKPHKDVKAVVCPITLFARGVEVDFDEAKGYFVFDEGEGARKAAGFDFGLTDICFGAFSTSSQLIEAILPNQLETIGCAAFEDCSSLKKVRFGQKLSHIRNRAFKGCSSLKEAIFSDALKEIDERVFEGCELLMKVIFGSAAVHFGRGAFRNCSSIESVFIPDGYSGSVQSPFEGCTSLKTISVPRGLARAPWLGQSDDRFKVTIVSRTKISN